MLLLTIVESPYLILLGMFHLDNFTFNSTFEAAIHTRHSWAGARKAPVLRPAFCPPQPTEGPLLSNEIFSKWPARALLLQSFTGENTDLMNVLLNWKFLVHPALWHATFIQSSCMCVWLQQMSNKKPDFVVYFLLLHSWSLFFIWLYAK